MQNFKRSVGVLLALAVFTSTAVQAAQVLIPVRNGVGGDISTGPTPGGVSLPAGTVLPIDVQYSIVNASGQTQTKDEAGLGLKVQYDATKFDPVITYDVNGVQTSTSISNLITKCMIASPSDQLVSGNTREVVFGWIDTSIRAGGAVGWLGTVDPAAPGAANGCLNPGSIVTTSAAFDAVAAPVTLFRVGLKSKIGFSAGSTNVVITTAGNISYANANNVDTNKTILVNAAPAPTCNLDVDGSGGTPTASIDGLLIKRALNPFIPAANILIGITLPGSATRITGPDIRAYVLGLGNVLDVDTNGTATPAASVDGLLIQRALNTFISSASVTTGITTPATGSQVRTYLNTNCGTSLTP